MAICIAMTDYHVHVIPAQAGIYANQLSHHNRATREHTIIWRLKCSAGVRSALFGSVHGIIAGAMATARRSRG